MAENPTQVLSKEHEKILKAIHLILDECKAVEKGKKLDKKFFENAVSFIRNYADKFHHAKEEDILFKEIESNLTHCNPIPQMLHEHELGRGFVKGIKQGIEENNEKKIIKNARGYAGLLQEHIFKEDNILYPMAEENMTKEVKNSIMIKFKKIEEKKPVKDLQFIK